MRSLRLRFVGIRIPQVLLFTQRWMEPRPGLEPGTCRLLRKYHVADSVSSFLRLASRFFTVFAAYCSLPVPGGWDDLSLPKTSFVRVCWRPTFSPMVRTPGFRANPFWELCSTTKLWKFLCTNSSTTARNLPSSLLSQGKRPRTVRLGDIRVRMPVFSIGSAGFSVGWTERTGGYSFRWLNKWQSNAR